eukprot:1093704-Lingulodinium_polyedra.AAC.1
MRGARKLGRHRAPDASGSAQTACPSVVSPSCFGTARDSSTPCSATPGVPDSTTAASSMTSTYCAVHHSTRSSMAPRSHRS